MSSYQIGSAATIGLDNPVGGGNIQEFQDQGAMSWPSSSSLPTAACFDVGNSQLSSDGNAPQPGSGKVREKVPSINFLCDHCQREFSKQFELTLVFFPTLSQHGT